MKKNARRFFCWLLMICQLFSITAYAKPDWPSDVGIVAEAGIVYDMDSGAMLYGQNSRLQYPPASITKLLTALIVLEHCKPDEIVTFSETAIHSVEADSGNRLSLTVGDQLTVEDCLYALLLVSANQAANALAEHTAGSISAFVDMMNARVAELGCTGSHFENPSGLNGDTQYVTAYDMALIATAAFSNEELLKISSSLTHTIEATINNPDGVSFQHEHRLLYTENSSSQYYYPPAVAGKTGYLIRAGNTLVTYAEQDGRRLVSVILKGTPRQYFVDGKNLLQFGFDRFQNYPISDYETRYVTGDSPVELNGLSYRPADLMLEEGRAVTLPKGADFSDAELELLDRASMPAGDHPANVVGMLRYTYNDRLVGQAYLLAGEFAVHIEGEETSASEEGSAPETSAPAAAGDTEDPSGNTGSPDADGEASKPANAGEPSTSPSSGGLSILAAIRERFPGNPVIIAAVLLVVALAGVFLAFTIYARKKEAQARARRRAERMRRLQASGDEERFNQLMEEKRKRKNP